MGTDAVERRIGKLAADLYEQAEAELPRIRASHRWEMEVLRWCMKDPPLRTRILRFIDCLPALSDPRDVVRHLREYLASVENARLPAALRWGIAAARPSLWTAPAAAAVTRRAVGAIARLFIAGATLEEAAPPIRRMREEGLGVTVDLLGEATVSQREAEEATGRYLNLLQRWSSLYLSKPHLSLKLSSLAFPFDPLDPEGAWRQIRPRLGSILRAAARQGGFINVDMEQHHVRDLTLELVQRLLETDFPEEAGVGVVIQSYLQDAEPVTRRLLEWTLRRGVPITIRLVRGAYWDTEMILSRQLGWPCPVFQEKEQSDACFDRLTDLLLENHPHIRPAVGTHNVRSLARAVVKAEELGVPPDRWECQMLYGMSLPLQRAILRRGLPLRIYTPVGELIPGMAYLVRRILENTSQYSFLAHAAV